ncbi:MAG: hypothetical protein QGF67_09195 [Lentisphaeria bacterium]|nr:hypothetical protein [Lentisphaeria bacterium]MDP7741603.1 hypothetical protein [Lentisphaeria bacterium]
MPSDETMPAPVAIAATEPPADFARCMELGVIHDAGCGGGSMLADHFQHRRNLGRKAQVA